VTAVFAGPVEEPLASIHGVVQTSTSKRLIVETDDANSIEFYCTKKTRYFEGKKRLKAEDLKKGDLVRVESRTNILGDADAVNVYREPVKQ
jgi:hypothetical protein